MTPRNGHFTTIVMAFAICMLFLVLWQSRDSISQISSAATESVANANKNVEAPLKHDVAEFRTQAATEVKLRPSFYDIAKKFGTDKVTDHHYNFMYEKYLEPLRDRKLKMLEIGLGCDMSYGPGASYHTWLEYLPNVELYYVEYNGECVNKWKEKTPGATIFTGDQSNATFLEEVIAKSGGKFDIIIDDGGHYMNQQMISLETLYKSILPGGIYFCEDLGTSYDGWYEGGEGKVTMMGMIKDLLDDLNYNTPGRPAPKYTFAKDIRSVECGEQICSFHKKRELQ